jgi:hypothetical protein
VKLRIARLRFIQVFTFFLLLNIFSVSALAETTVEKVANPVFEPISGEYKYELTFSITCPTENAEIHYTTNGSAPDLTSPVYSGQMTITETTIIKAVAFKEGLTDSDMVTAGYTITVPAPPEAPVILAEPAPPAGLTYVTITCPTNDAVIFYSLSGGDPLQSEQYTGTFNIDYGTTITAIAVLDQRQYSDVVTLAIPELRVSTPVFLPASKNVLPDEVTTVSISSQTEGADIYYTTDGSVPTEGSLLYTGPFKLWERRMSGQSPIRTDSSRRMRDLFRTHIVKLRIFHLHPARSASRHMSPSPVMTLIWFWPIYITTSTPFIQDRS